MSAWATSTLLSQVDYNYFETRIIFSIHIDIYKNYHKKYLFSAFFNTCTRSLILVSTSVQFVDIVILLNSQLGFITTKYYIKYDIEFC